VPAKQLVGVFSGVSGDAAWLSYRFFLVLALISRKFRYLVAAKQLVGVFSGVSCGITLLSYQDFLILTLNIKKIRNLSKRDIDLSGDLWCFS